MSWARSLPAPLRRPLSRLVHAAWEGAADLGAIGPDDPRGRRFGRMGAGACLLFPQGALYNEHLIHIGAETIIGPGASISAGMAPGQEMPTDPVVSIGSRTLIGRGSHIVGHWEIVIGDDIQTGPYVYITDQNHSYDDPVEPIGRQWPTEAPVRIGSGSWLGANAVILPGAQIGEHVVVAAGAVVRGEVPDRCVVAGVPARIVKRWVEGTGWVTEKDVAASVTVPFLVTVSGQDGPGIAERLFAALAERCIDVDDVEQVRVHGRLLLCVEAGMERAEAEPVRALLEDRFAGAGVVVAVDPLVEAAMDDVAEGHLVTLLAPEIDAATLETVTGSIARCGGNIVRILRLAAYPVHSYEFTVAHADVDALRRALAEAAARCQVDVAVQAAGLHRRAKHLIVLDADSTLLQGEMIDLLADRCGCGPEVAAVTEAAMAGEIDFADALRQRVRLLAGLKEADLEAVRDGIVLTPGARTLVRTLKRLGYELAVVSGGFTQVIGPLVTELGIDHLAANELVVDGGVVTGELTGAIVDRAGKAEALVTFAAAAGVPVARTIAVGDGANDIDMLAAAGLGIAFNAKPVVREAADAALSVPYLDAILFLLGISRREVELADRLEEAGSV